MLTIALLNLVSHIGPIWHYYTQSWLRFASPSLNRSEPFSCNLSQSLGDISVQCSGLQPCFIKTYSIIIQDFASTKRNRRSFHWWFPPLWAKIGTLGTILVINYNRLIMQVLKGCILFAKSVFCHASCIAPGISVFVFFHGLPFHFIKIFM